MRTISFQEDILNAPLQFGCNSNIKIVIKEFIKQINCKVNDNNLLMRSYLVSGIKNENYHQLTNQIEMFSVKYIRETKKQPALLTRKEVRKIIDNLLALFKKYNSANSLSKTLNYFNRTPIQIIEFELKNIT